MPGTLRFSSLLASSLSWSMVFLLAMSACVSTGKLKDGETAFRLGKYQVAVDMLQEEYASERNPAIRAQRAFQLAESYDALNRPKQAEQWFGRAYEAGYGPEALYAQAMQRKKLEDYAGAIEALESYLLEAPEYRAEIRREIAASRRAKDALGGDTYYEVTNEEALNSPAGDFGPVWIDNKTLVFTSSRAGSQGEADDEWSGGFYYDLFATTRQGASWSEPAPFDELVNGAFHEGTPTLTADKEEMIYTQCGSLDKKRDDACRLLYRYRNAEGLWSEPEELVFFGDSVNIGHPAFAPNGQRLYFAAAGDPESYGGVDLYYVNMTDAGWGSPINLGPTINTAGNEVFPHVALDGTLYFASDGHPGMGGLDLFQTREEKKKWQRPEALGYPVNGGSDDFGLALDPRQSQHPDTLVLGLFSSTRSGGQGEDDLYRFILRKAPPPPPLYRLEGDIVEAILADPEDPASAVAEYKALPDASLVLTDASAGQELGALALDKTGRFTAELGPATEYRLRASRDGYFNVSETATTIGLPETPGDTFTVTARLVMARIPARNKDITLEDIYYDFDDTTLRAESFPSLAKLTKLLAENPTLRVEIGSHTDSRGEKPYNQRLSRGRANSVVAYLERQGIAPVRMEAKGYGETRLLNRCLDGVSCTEEEHQRNRRTTFKVLGEIELESLPPDEIEVDPRRRGR